MAFLKKISSAKTDTELVQEYRSRGDLNTLGELYERYMELVYGVCLKYFKEPEEAKDAVINIFEELISKLKKYEVVNFKGWLYQLTRNHCLMKIRGRKSEPALVDRDIMQLAENNHLDSIAKKEEQLNGMENCIETLPSEQKQAIQLFYFQEQSYQEIANFTKADISKVRSYIQNGRRNLKICMEKKAPQKHDP